MKNKNIINYSIFKGKTREQIIASMGENFLPESDEHSLVYIINKNWLTRRVTILYIEFNAEGEADTFYTQKR